MTSPPKEIEPLDIIASDKMLDLIMFEDAKQHYISQKFLSIIAIQHRNKLNELIDAYNQLARQLQEKK